LRGDVYLQQQLNDQALADFDAAVKLSPKSFRSNLGRARALLALQQYRLAYRQLNNTRPLAETDSDLAAIYYWRAQSLEGLGDLDSAHDDWEALLALAPEVLQEGWEKTAVEHLSGVLTPTP
jgi:tetratricopeptide (TPR) repeat protein